LPADWQAQRKPSDNSSLPLAGPLS
jgi:hypothetical protein